MELTTWFSFVTIALITTVTPGPATLLALSNSVKFGPANAFWSSFGNAIGLLLVSIGVITGLGAILHSSALLFTILKFTGAVYLIYMGYKQWRSGYEYRDTQCRNTGSDIKKGKLFLQGVVVALTNPKAIVFFLGIFPLFIDPSTTLLPQFSILTITFSFCGLISHSIYLTLSSPINRSLKNLKRVKLFNRLVGSIFTLMGFSLFWIKRS